MDIEIGSWVNHRLRHGGHALAVFEPATGAIYARLHEADAEIVRAAVAGAAQAFPAWSRLRPSERAGWLNQLADAIEAELDAFAEAESRDTGKPIQLCREIEIPRAISNFRFFAAAAMQFASESHHGEAGLNYTLRQPLGVVGTISPWNLPLYLLTWKIAPALAAGNCVVAKPSEVTPLTAHLLGRLAADIGFPEGVLQIIQGSGISAGIPLVTHPLVKAISFTGSTAVGKQIALQCAEQLKKCSLELGGKNAALVFADAPRDGLYETLLRSSFQNAGQICLCGSRILVEQSFYDDFVTEFVARAKALQPGDPAAPETRLGAVVSSAHYQKILDAIATARAEGGNIACGGGAATMPRMFEGGWFIAPTVITGLAPQCQTNQQEIFGPVVTVSPFVDDADALAQANATRYGLAAQIWTSDLQRAHRLAQAIDAGIIWINTWMTRDLRTPFGGMRDSGLGREGGVEAMRFFTEPKNVCLAL
ncbi:2-hydroxymuconic semialdehyde dehydrogenase [Ahniella affigens]|uniref:2-hydroxymuconic semialdehyde dehydrogenase n=1 Tax=Ahniella affigens TaxID=2021234 RepID=A0A2P1PLR5_9GAMM|nr:aldehyde dehydrogenase [Ahniella affigens]AVP95781.1 2-hydroxymuconic semialdehyde dehydrogenase [Ahniella affigens]